MPGPLDSRTEAVGNGRQHRFHVVEDGAAAPQRRPVTVLYVEDDADDVFLLGRYLESMPSFEVEYAHAATLVAARAMIARHRFDVVLCDFWLGSETTIPLIDELKSAIVPCPVVLVSSLENEDIELIGRRAGAAGFVAKADISAATLDRVFNTLLPPEDRDGGQGVPGRGVARWLRALLRSLDRVHAASTLALADDETARSVQDLMEDIVSNSSEIRNDVMEKLAGLERATRQGSGAKKFDAVPYFADAIRGLAGRSMAGAAVDFTTPAMPIMIESSPALFGDLIQGFFAEAGEELAAGRSVAIAPTVADGRLDVEIRSIAPASPGPTSGVADDRDARAVAAAEARRFVVETLACACGGHAHFGSADGGVIGHLGIPLRVSFD